MIGIGLQEGEVKKFSWAVKEEKDWEEGLERGLFRGGLVKETGLGGEEFRETGTNWLEGG